MPYIPNKAWEENRQNLLRLEQENSKKDAQIKRMFDCCGGHKCVGSETCKESPDHPVKKERKS